MEDNLPTPVIVMIVAFVILIVVIFGIVRPVLIKKDRELYEKMKSKTSNTVNENDFLQNLKEAVNKTVNPNSNIKYCEYCGTELEENATKCPSCGAKSKKK